MVKRFSQLDSTFSALSDPTRRAILARLALGEANVTDLAEPFRMSLPAVSKHLRILESAGLLRREIDGRVHRLRLHAQPMQQAAGWIAQYRKFWETQFDSLATYLASTTAKEHHPWQRHKKRKASPSRSAAPSLSRAKKSSPPGPSRIN